MMKVYLHNLRDVIEKVQKAVKQLTMRFNAIENNEFDRRLSDAKTKVYDIYGKANMTANEDANNLNITIDVVGDLNSTVSRLATHVEQLNRQEHELQLLVNKTSNFTETAYSCLQPANISRHLTGDLRNNIERFIQPLESARESMSVLNNTLWRLVPNLTTVSQSELVKITQVLVNVKIVQGTMDNNAKNIDLLQNKTQRSLKYGQETLRVAMNISEQIRHVFRMSTRIVNMVKHLAKLIDANKNITIKLNDSIFIPGFQSIIKNASYMMKDANQQSTLANIVQNNTVVVLSEAKIVQEYAMTANDSASQTLHTAHTTLKTLQDFPSISENATKTAMKSLQVINSVKEESNRSIHEIMKVSESVKYGLEYTTEANKLADDAYSLANAENQVCFQRLFSCFSIN